MTEVTSGSGRVSIPLLVEKLAPLKGRGYTLAGREGTMAIQVSGPGSSKVDCPECGSQMRRTEMTREEDELVIHLECPSCGHKGKRPLS
jgi:predicted RNA-binding Zn-ribbon protein involved in translation (DUF1610 family)